MSSPAGTREKPLTSQYRLSFSSSLKALTISWFVSIIERPSLFSAGKICGILSCHLKSFFALSYFILATIFSLYTTELKILTSAGFALPFAMTAAFSWMMQIRQRASWKHSTTRLYPG